MENEDKERLARLQKSIEEVLPMVKAVFPIDVMFALTDRESFQYYLPGAEIDIHAEAGMPIPPQSGIRKSIDTGETVTANLGKEIYGVPFKSTTLPVLNESGAAAGAFTIGISLSNQETLNGAANYLATSSDEIRAVTDEIAATATALATGISDLKQLGQQVVEEISKTDEILQIIKQVANSSGLLGLNASIEAAHAGEHGRGFGIVAKEVRKMADSSASAAKEIDGILASIHQSVSKLGETLEDCFSQSERQAAATEQIAASMQQLTASAEDIKKIAQLI